MKNLFSWLLIFYFLGISCNEQQNEKKDLILDFKEWQEKTTDFCNKYCKTCNYISPFNEVLKNRKILAQTTNIVNDLLKEKNVNEIVFSGIAYDVGSINIIIIVDDTIGYKFVSSDSVCNDLSFVYKTVFNPNAIEEAGCEFISDYQNVTIEIKLDDNSNYSIFRMVFK